jgi:Ca2+:H+ antiporter
MMIKIGKFSLLLLVFIPISFYFGLFGQDRALTFITSVLAIIPLARIIGYSTKELTLQTNPVFGGFLNATFGNAVELVIAFLALREGLSEIVQASLVGSILSNILLLIGLSIFFGGLKYKEQRFNKTSAGVSSTMLIIAVVGLAIPTVYSLAVEGDTLHERVISDAVAMVLALIYIAGLVFAFVTHKHLFDASDEIKASAEKPEITVKTAVIILLLAMLVVVFESEFMVGSIKPAMAIFGLTQTFIGVVVIAILANIAEKLSAIHFAVENKLDVSLEIGLSSAIQIALFVVPILVFVSHIFGYRFSLIFSLFEIISIFFAVMIVNYLSSDGKCNWLEGAQLISVYLIITIAFYFI